MSRGGGEIVDVRFRVRGEAPRDHAYRLYAALCRYLPELHPAPGCREPEEESVGIHMLRGARLPGLRFAAEALTLRVPAERLERLERLRGRTLCIEPQGSETWRETAQIKIHRGPPEVLPLRPAQSLQGPVCLRLHALDDRHLSEEEEALRYREGLRAYVARLGIEARVDVLWAFRFQVHLMLVLGMQVRISQLQPEDAVRLQEEGIGCKRAMGCGLLLPEGPHHLIEQIHRLRGEARHLQKNLGLCPPRGAVPRAVRARSEAPWFAEAQAIMRAAIGGACTVSRSGHTVIFSVAQCGSRDLSEHRLVAQAQLRAAGLPLPGKAGGPSPAP